MAIGIFCGSSTGHEPVYAEAAAHIGRYLARRRIDIVYGGGHVGLMGVLADSALAAGGTVIGVIPQSLVDRELAHAGISELITVNSMHARKAKMAKRSEAFLALPGGIGTLDEMFEQWTWAQLGIHAKPCAFLNVAGYFDPLRAMIGHMVSDGFLSDDHADMIAFVSDAEAVLAHFEAVVPVVEKWHRAPL